MLRAARSLGSHWCARLSKHEETLSVPVRSRLLGAGKPEKLCLPVPAIFSPENKK